MMFLDDDGPHAHSTAVFVGVTVTFIVATAFLVARLIARFHVLKQPGWDDLAITLGWVCRCILTIGETETDDTTN